MSDRSETTSRCEGCGADCAWLEGGYCRACWGERDYECGVCADSGTMEFDTGLPSDPQRVLCPVCSEAS